MRAFTRLYLRLDATTSTSEKVEALADYLRAAPPEDGAWAVAFLTGNRPRGSASSRVVRELALRESALPAWLFDASRAAVGDLSETIALVLPEPPGPAAEPVPLHRVVEAHVLPLVGAPDDERARVIAAAWARMTRDERFVYLKMIRGGFRVGVQRRLLARALASVAGVDQAVLEHRLAGGVAPTPEAFGALLAPEGEGERALRPYPFFLAHPLESAADTPEALGDPARWTAEWKWDGVRAQLARHPAGVSIWSRGEELITHQFPELAAAAAALPEGTVLDGEILLWHADGRPAPFAALQRRLNRKHAPTDQPLLFQPERPVFLAFDLLEHAGEDLRALPQDERRRRLDALPLPDDTLRRSEPVPFDAWDRLAALRETSRARGVEGLVLKHRDAPYLAGRVRPAHNPGWLKWKVDPRTVDAVLVHALPGSGRRATLYTDYAFAVWNEGRTELVVFARAYSGLTQEEIEELDAWIRRHTRARKGPVREVRPQRVFEIGFEGIARSTRHKAGVAVRFPRILRERTDKGPDDADTLAALVAMLPAEEGK